MGQRCAPAALDRSAPMRCATRPAARQRPLQDAENFDGEVSFEPPSRFTSFKHLVGAAEKRERDRKAERLGGLEVDVQLDFAGLLDRQIGGVVALENPAGIESDDSMSVRDA